MFKIILIANRGEIARRITKTAHKMGIKVVAVYSEADKNSLFVKEADFSECIGAAPASESYLDVSKIIEAAAKHGAEAIHPGYGFLSESLTLIKACKLNGLVFIGPSEEAIIKMGSKVSAKECMREANVPLLPGSKGVLKDVEEAVILAEEIGYPVMLKAVAGGGGIGMTLCKKEKKLRAAFEENKSKGERFFGNGDLLLEKYLEEPHHIEVQILGDSHGNIIHLFERECSIQRRHQKILEESPSPFLTEEKRLEICAAGLRAAQSVDYDNAGTVEFIVDSNSNFYFLEMNTRLQVEHALTEMNCDIDLVEWQLRVANGEKLSPDLKEIKPKGHSIECRICAENPEKRFMPSPGTISEWEIMDIEDPSIRFDSAVQKGDEITPFYDSMFAKLIVHAEDRESCMKKLTSVLSEIKIEGIDHNLSVFKRILSEESFKDGVYSTAFIKDVLKLKF